jgi:LEA14-like dessication related protein
VKRMLLPAIVLCLPACSTLVPDLETPRLSVVDVQVEQAGIWEQRLKVRMRVQNPNDRQLPIRGLTYTLQVAGQDLARGITDTAFTVPALGEAEFDMNVTANAASALIKYLGKHDAESSSDSVDYRLVGKVSLSQGMLRSIPFEERGTFRLR